VLVAKAATVDVPYAELEKAFGKIVERAGALHA
jgi:hypothetical protein